MVSSFPLLVIGLKIKSDPMKHKHRLNGDFRGSSPSSQKTQERAKLFGPDLGHIMSGYDV